MWQCNGRQISADDLSHLAMKICVLGLDGATAGIAFTDERLVNLRRLMDMGVYGALKAPSASTIALWLSMGASQAPESINASTTFLWDLLASLENRSAIVGLISDLPPHEINGVSIACFPHACATGEIAIQPAQEASSENQGHALLDQISAAARTRWETARALFGQQRWAYFQLIDLGLQTLGNSPDAEAQASSDYCQWLDEQIGTFLELLDEEVILLVLSPRGVERNATSNEVQNGMFILIAPNCPLTGEFHGATLLDMAPTLLDLLGREIPSAMEGRSLLQQMQKRDLGPGTEGNQDEESLIRDRLAGLGYI